MNYRVDVRVVETSSINEVLLKKVVKCVNERIHCMFEEHSRTYSITMELHTSYRFFEDLNSFGIATLIGANACSHFLLIIERAN